MTQFAHLHPANLRNKIIGHFKSYVSRYAHLH
jgi:hypothetical protein